MLQNTIFLPADIDRHWEITRGFVRDLFYASFGNYENYNRDAGRDGEIYRKWVEEIIKKDPLSVLHLWRGDEIIGMLTLNTFKPEPTAGYVNMIYIKPEFRERGFGQILQKKAEDLLLLRGHREAYLSVAPENVRANRLYKKFGWVDLGQRKEKPEVHLLKKTLLPPSFETEFRAGAGVFLEKMYVELDPVGINLGCEHIDHICWRTETLEEYRTICFEVSRFGRLLAESPIHGRPISAFRLHRPIIRFGNSIYLIEVPAPKSGKDVTSGFEHIELTLRGSRKNLPKPPKGVKYQEVPLECTIATEQDPRGARLLGHPIMKELAEYSPTIIGTIPIGLDNSESDLDVICEMPNLTEPRVLKRENLDEKIQIEVYAQSLSVSEQNGLRHMIAEYRILSLRPDLRAHVVSARGDGMKTEPAFARVLGISGDPYEELRRLSLLSEADLRREIRAGL